MKVSDSLGECKPGAPFHKRLRWMIESPPSGSIKMVVTPAMAEEMLKFNTGNRPPSPQAVKDYARQMKSGLWLYNRQPVIFSDDGQLNDGQHRLKACVESGCSFETDVVFGAPRESFAVTDRGRKRSSADIFAIRGVPNYIAIAAAVSWVWRYENTGMNSPSGGDAPSSDELFVYYEQHPDLQKSLTSGKRFHEAKLAPPSLMAALHYLCARKNRAHADAFFEKAATGVGVIKKSDPAGRLRQRLIDEAIGGSRLSPIYIAAFTVMSWNASREGVSAPLLRWRGEQSPNQPFPRVK